MEITTLLNPSVPPPTDRQTQGSGRELGGISPVLANSMRLCGKTQAVSISATAPPPDSSLDPKSRPCCNFVENCDLGSELRKVVSHFFGRNKTCTLRIPQHVWVHYCRKHYQRARYHKGKNWPLAQIELIKLQILRLKDWSGENEKRRTGPSIARWAISLRKRQQSGSGSDIQVDDGSPDSQDPVEIAIPEWLIQMLGSNHATERIEFAANRIHKEIQADELTQVPEIEFLPDIVVDGTSAFDVRRHNQITTLKSKAPEAPRLCRNIRNRPRGHYASPGEMNGQEGTPRKRARLVAHDPKPLPQESLRFSLLSRPASTTSLQAEDKDKRWPGAAPSFI